MSTSNPDTSSTLDGIYMLRGIHDMASGFKFTPDGRFEFFYIYGVADRNATGTYTLEGDTIKLKSDKEGGKDFLVNKQSKQGKGVSIQVTAPNPQFLSNITAIYRIGEETKETFSNNYGQIQIDDPGVDQIYLIHDLFPDIVSLIKDKDNPNNHFEVSLSPSLMQVSFVGIDFVKDGDTLTCLPNYFMPFDRITFIKTDKPE